MRVLALDHGEARCGCAVSDPSGTLASPLTAIERPGTRKGLARVAGLAAELGAELIVVGLPITLGGEEGAQADTAREFARRLEARVRVPVELYDERLTTRMAEATGGRADSDSRAAAHLLESYLTARAGQASRGVAQPERSRGVAQPERSRGVAQPEGSRGGAQPEGSSGEHRTGGSSGEHRTGHSQGTG